MTIDDVARQFHTLTPDDSERFEEMAAVVRAFQGTHNPVYTRFRDAGGSFLPIAAFKLATVAAFDPAEAERVFESSGTTQSTPSRHFVRSLELYERSVCTHFEAVFGPGPFTFLAHLPHYEAAGERSSLVHMVETLIRRYGDEHSRFFLDDHEALEAGVDQAARSGTPFLLFGAAFGLLDVADDGPRPLPFGARVIETGGMKTYRREIAREELHGRLAEAFHVPVANIWGEYGMCELLSQAWAREGGVYYAPPWMRTQIVDPDDPMREVEEGVLAVTDLANLYTVSDILTEDLAVRRGKGFEILGRRHDAELRGCNFLVE